MLFYYVYFSFVERNLKNLIENFKKKKYFKGMFKIFVLFRVFFVKVEYIKEKGR